MNTIPQLRLLKSLLTRPGGRFAVKVMPPQGDAYVMSTRPRAFVDIRERYSPDLLVSIVNRAILGMLIDFNESYQ